MRESKMILDKSSTDTNASPLPSRDCSSPTHLKSLKEQKGKWSNEEDSLLFSLLQTYGTQWIKMVPSFPEKNDTSIKNRFYSVLRSMIKRYNQKITKVNRALKKSHLEYLFEKNVNLKEIMESRVEYRGKNGKRRNGSHINEFQLKERLIPKIKKIKESSSLLPICNSQPQDLLILNLNDIKSEKSSIIPDNNCNLQFPLPSREVQVFPQVAKSSEDLQNCLTLRKKDSTYSWTKDKSFAMNQESIILPGLFSDFDPKILDLDNRTPTVDNSSFYDFPLDKCFAQSTTINPKWELIAGCLPFGIEK